MMMIVVELVGGGGCCFDRPAWQAAAVPFVEKQTRRQRDSVPFARRNTSGDRSPQTAIVSSLPPRHPIVEGWYGEKEATAFGVGNRREREMTATERRVLALKKDSEICLNPCTRASFFICPRPKETTFLVPFLPGGSQR